MPVAVFDLPTLSASAVPAVAGGNPRQLIPGVEPGGSRVGQPLKPALLIHDAWIQFINATTLDTAQDFNMGAWDLLLGQEQDMINALVMPVGQVSMQILDPGVGATDQPVTGNNWAHRQVFKAQGTVWAPKYVGVSFVELGTVDLQADVFLDYEVVEIPWMEWFVKWDFLDHISGQQRDY